MNRFYNFMCFCGISIHKNGILKSEPVNLKQRKLLDQTSEEFLDFMEAKNFRPIID
jgi:hypothetical protein